MSFEEIRFENESGVGIITLNRPKSLNAMTLNMVAEINRALDSCTVEQGVRAVLLAAEGRGFSSGVDLMETAGAGGGKGISTRMVLEDHFNPLLLRMRTFPLPIVAAVQGACAGVGMSFALTADLVIAAPSAYFLQAFRRIGLVPDGGATWLLPRLVGRARAMELGLLGERLPAETAREWGLINRVVEEDRLLEEGKALARNLASGPTVALGYIRRLFWDSEENDYEAQLSLEARLQDQASKTADFREGVKAFSEKREAQFAGR